MNKKTDFINKLQNPADREYYSKLLGGASGISDNPQRDDIPEISTPAAGDGMITDAKSFYQAVNETRKAAGLPERKIEMPEILDTSMCCTIDNMTSLRVEAARLKAGYVF